MKMTVIPRVIDAFGTVLKRLERGWKELKMTVKPILIDAFATVLKGLERGRK